VAQRPVEAATLSFTKIKLANLKMPKSNQMRAHRILISCPQCGEQFSLLWREIKRNHNLTLTCASCGLVHLALNAIKLAVHNGLKEGGYPVGEPPVPEPIDPVRVFPSKNGLELVFRRYKTTGEVAYYRRAKRRPKKSALKI
jgi:predicted RNA-binding Zn-ribbon protein involved in translation (DUF1610 family)